MAVPRAALETDDGRGHPVADTVHGFRYTGSKETEGIEGAGLTTLLAAILTLWEPLTFASTVAATARSLAFRGPVAIVEIAAVGVIAMASVAASWSLLNGAPHGIPLARIALVATTAREVVALYWTRLPSNVAPGTRGLYAAMMIAHAIAWLTYLARLHRRASS